MYVEMQQLHRIVHSSFLLGLGEKEKEIAVSNDLQVAVMCKSDLGLFWSLFPIAYSHILEGGKIVQAKLIKRACTAKIRIWFPEDVNDRRAIVMVDGPHNHPTPACTKLSREGRERYNGCIIAAGPRGLTAAKCDKGMH